MKTDIVRASKSSVGYVMYALRLDLEDNRSPDLLLPQTTLYRCPPAAAQPTQTKAFAPLHALP
jgi:hypothetical protein